MSDSVDLASAGEEAPSTELLRVWTAVLQSQEDTRKWIALSLLALLAAIVIAAIGAMFMESLAVARVKDVLALVLGPLLGLVGSVVGFYFGAQTAQQSG